MNINVNDFNTNMNNSIVKRRLIEQEENVKTILKKQLVNRTGFEKYKKILDTDLIKAIIGPRRAGKTTLGLLLLKNKDFYYVNFDDEILSGIKKEELGTVLELLNEEFGKRQYIFLDEIQNIDGWELFANRLHRLGYNVIISGSNSNLLSKELSTHLGGRELTIEVLPFDFREFLMTKNATNIKKTDAGIGIIKNHLKKYIELGGYPEILLKMPEDLSGNYLNEIYNTVLFRDIGQRYKIRHMTELSSLTIILLSNFTTRQSLTRISKEIGVSVNTISKYLSYLNDSYLIISSKKFSYKPKEIELSFKKNYCIDCGLLQSKKITLTQDFGKLMENVVAIELHRQKKELYYYMAENKYEVDFVVVEGNKVKEVIQVSNDEKSLPKREIKTGLKACKELNCNSLKIITWNNSSERKEGDVLIKIIPLWKWLLER